VVAKYCCLDLFQVYIRTSLIKLIGLILLGLTFNSERLVLSPPTSPRAFDVGTAMGCVLPPFVFFLFNGAFDVGNPGAVAGVLRERGEGRPDAAHGHRSSSALRHRLGGEERGTVARKGGCAAGASGRASGLICGDGTWIVAFFACQDQARQRFHAHLTTAEEGSLYAVAVVAAGISLGRTESCTTVAADISLGWTESYTSIATSI
jgi:hypothetical protein